MKQAWNEGSRLYAGCHYIHVVDDVFYIVPALDTDLGAMYRIDR